MENLKKNKTSGIYRIAGPDNKFYTEDIPKLFDFLTETYDLTHQFRTDIDVTPDIKDYYRQFNTRLNGY